MIHRTARIAVWGAVAGAGLLAAYARLVRPWALRWGATAEEAARPLPGDGLVAKADYVATRAITIDAPPHQVWPWLVQIGSGRAGWYTYDRLDNAGMPSATEILPQLQQLAVGDLIPMVAGKDIGLRVKELEPIERTEPGPPTPGSASATGFERPARGSVRTFAGQDRHSAGAG